MAKFCISCGNEIPEGSSVCPNCGTPVDGAPKQPTTTVVVNNAQPKKSNGLAIAGFIISLVSAILCCGSFSVISLILSIIGAAKAKDLDGSGKGFAIAGIIISAIGILMLILLVVFGYAAAIIEETSYGY